MVLRTDRSGATDNIVRFYGQTLYIGGKSYTLTTDWTEVTIRLDVANDTATFTVGDEDGSFAYSGTYARLELYAAAAGAFDLHFDDMFIGSGVAAEPDEPGTDTADWIYNNDFDTGTVEGDVFYDSLGNSLKASGSTLVELNDNTVLKLQSTDRATGSLNDITQTNLITLRFKVMLIEGVDMGAGTLEIRQRNSSNRNTFATIANNAIQVGNADAYALSAEEWTEVEIVLDSANNKAYYKLNRADYHSETTVNAHEGGITALNLYMAQAFAGVYVDDFQILQGGTWELEPEKIDLDVTVVWEDGENNDDTHPDSVYVSVYNGLTLVAREEVTAANNWQHTFADLLKYDAEDNEIGYTVIVSDADAPTGYNVAVEGAVITLTHTPTAV